MLKKIIIGIAAVLIAAIAFATWYKFHYSMEIAESFEVNTPAQNPKVLIATQGSEFKDAVVSRVVDHLKPQQAYIKVIDVTALPQVNEDAWNVIVIIHTWESMKPQADVETYLGRSDSLNKLVVLTTSGRGNYKMETVDAITSASTMADVSARSLDIIKRIDSILASDAGK